MGRLQLDLSGQQFGRLTPVRIVGKGHQGMIWECLCDCGVVHLASVGNLRSGMILSCGCLNRENTSTRMKKQARTHGHTSGNAPSPTYVSYQNARKRCRYDKHNRYSSYGGRGIEFRFANFQEFLDELGERPVGMTVDRIDPDGHYEKGNVRWATPQEQQANTRRKKKLDKVISG